MEPNRVQIKFLLICNQRAFWTFFTILELFYLFNLLLFTTKNINAMMYKSTSPPVYMLYKYSRIKNGWSDWAQQEAADDGVGSHTLLTLTLQLLTHYRCLMCRFPGGVWDTFSEPLETVSALALTWDPRATADFSPCWASCREAH